MAVVVVVVLAVGVAVAVMVAMAVAVMVGVAVSDISRPELLDKDLFDTPDLSITFLYLYCGW